MESQIEELLVALACISNNGCSITTHVYYSYNPIVEQQIRLEAKKLNKYINQDVEAIAPIVFIMAGGNGSFHLTKSISLDIKRGEGLVSFKYDF